MMSRLAGLGLSRHSSSGSGLGRVVFERDQSIAPQNMNGFLILGEFFWVGISAAAIDAWGKPWNLLVPIAVPLVLGLAAGVVWLFRENVFRCHDRGVTRTVWRRTRQIRYEDVATFSYEGIRHLVNGAYSGTSIEMKFQPWPGGPGDPVTYKAMVSHSDEELEKLRDLISRAVAEGMRQRLTSGLPVESVRDTRFTTGGLELGPDTKLRRRGKEVVPYDEIVEYDMRQGEFYLYRRGAGKQELVFTAPVASPNFFPGFYLLAALTTATPRTNVALDS